MKTFSNEGKLITYTKGVAKGNYLNRKEMIKEGTLEYQERRIWRAKILVSAINFLSPVVFFRYFWWFEAKMY